MHSNWPELTSSFIMKLDDETQTSYSLTDEQHLRSRNKRANTFIELQDDQFGKVVLAPPGGGISLSGVSVIDIIESDFMIARLKDYEQDIRINAEVIQDTLKRETGIEVDPLDIQLVLDEGELCFKENTVGIHLIVDFIEPEN